MGSTETYPTVHWKEYLDPSNGKRVQRFIKSKGSVVFTELVKEIREAHENKIKNLVLLVHPNVSALVLINEDEYLEVLEHSLYYFLDVQDYKMCEFTKNIKNEIIRKSEK